MLVELLKDFDMKVLEKAELRMWSSKLVILLLTLLFPLLIVLYVSSLSVLDWTFVFIYLTFLYICVSLVCGRHVEFNYKNTHTDRQLKFKALIQFIIGNEVQSSVNRLKLLNELKLQVSHDKFPSIIKRLSYSLIFPLFNIAVLALNHFMFTDFCKRFCI